jgi:hypothetical protein
VPATRPPPLLQGAAYLLANSTDALETAAGILAVEAYHAGAARILLAQIADQVGGLGVPLSCVPPPAMQ